MRILSAYYTHKPGGFCKRLYRLLNALSRNGHEVHYISLDPPGKGLDSAVVFERIPFFLKSRRGFLFWLSFSLYAPVYFLLVTGRLKPARLVLFNPYYACAFALASRLCKIPLLLFVRASLASFQKDLPFRSLLLKFFDLAGLLSASKIICQTESAEITIRERLGRHTREVGLLPNHIDKVTERAGNPEHRSDTKLHCLCTGLFVPGKNISLLIAAFHRLEQHYGHERLCLDLVGEGPAVPQIKSDIERLGLRSVNLLGWQEEINGFYERADLFLMPSLAEGMPNSLLEALAAGLAVLASDIPVHREILQHEELLFPAKDPAKLADRLARVLANRSDLQYLANLSTGRARAYVFDWDQAAVAAVEGDSRRPDGH